LAAIGGGEQEGLVLTPRLPDAITSRTLTRIRRGNCGTMSSADLKANRPLSPHLSIYRWQMTMVMSIAHRLTGVALYFGTLLLAIWLIAAATGPRQFDAVNAVAGSWLGLIVLFGYTWALLHHMLGGLRHFVWDTGHGLDKPARDQLAAANLILSIVLTVAVWAIVVWLK
jgi:succinate dehydrogenase / fumarate reductase cytochrome b subunit